MAIGPSLRTRRARTKLPPPLSRWYTATRGPLARNPLQAGVAVAPAHGILQAKNSSQTELSPEEPDRPPMSTVQQRSSSARTGQPQAPPRPPPERGPEPESQPAASAAPAPAPPPQAAPPRSKRRRLLLLVPILFIVGAIGGTIGYRYWYDSAYFVSTDNASVTGDLIQIGSLNAGRLVSAPLEVGQQVARDQVIAEVAVPQQVGAVPFSD